MWLGGLLVLVVVVAVIWLLARAAGSGERRRDHRPEAESPEQILKQRYARGEIDREEYESRLADLRR
jgi:putative membrane protein